MASLPVVAALSSPSARPHVLLFDRDEAVLEVMRAALAASGAEVSVASSIEEVLAVVERRHVDVIATDEMMRPADRCALVIALETAPCRRARATRLVRLRCSAPA